MTFLNSAILVSISTMAAVVHKTDVGPTGQEDRTSDGVRVDRTVDCWYSETCDLLSHSYVTSVAY